MLDSYRVSACDHELHVSRTYPVFAGIAEFERALILSRTSARRVAAQQKGVRFGRPPALAPDLAALGRKLVEEGQTVREVARLLKVHRATLYRKLAKPGT